jgi:hypothetical protein
VLTDEPFVRRPELTDTPREDLEGQQAVEFRVGLADSVLPWAREDLPYGFVREEPAEDGAVFVIESNQERRIVPWILCGVPRLERSPTRWSWNGCETRRSAWLAATVTADRC